jgi:putative ABC transport system permease protein
MPTSPIVSLVLKALRVIALIVPRRDRDAWRREWEGEIVHARASFDAGRRATWRADMSLARRASGSIVDAAWLRRQVTRDSELLHDLRHGVRLARSRPAVFLTATIVLTLAIGAVAIAGTALYHFVLAPLPYPDSGRILTLWESRPARGERQGDVAPANLFDWRARATTLSQVAGVEPWSVDLSENGRVDVVIAAKVTPGFFEVFSQSPLIGRTFHDVEYGAGRDQVVVLSHGFWTRRFGGDPTIVGRTLTLDGKPHQVIGVLRPDFDTGLLPTYRQRDAWLPNVVPPETAAQRFGTWWHAVARVKPDRTAAEAIAEMATISDALAAEYPAANKGMRALVTPLRDYLQQPVRQPVAVGAVAALIVLIIACANVANLLLTLGLDRQRELAVRGALGASRVRLVRQLLAESLVMTGTGAAAGIALAAFALPAIATTIPATVPRLSWFGFGWITAAAAATGAVLALVMVGAAPALAITRGATQEALRTTRTATMGRGRRWLREGLAIGELALTLSLVAGSALLLRSYATLSNVAPGFSPAGVAALQVFAYDGFATPDAQVAFFDESLRRIRGLPTVEAAGAVSAMPFMESNISVRAGVVLDGQVFDPNNRVTAFMSVATPGYFEAMAIPVLRGRGLEVADTATSELIAVVSDEAARTLWGALDPVGRYATVRWSGKPRRVRIAGVVGSARHDGLTAPKRDEIFLPLSQTPYGSLTYVVRSSGDPALLIEPIKAQVWALAPQQTFYDVVTLDGMIRRWMAPHRLGLVLVCAMGLVALVVSVVGIYGVMSVATRARTQEIGVRLALGARRADIFRLVLGRGLAIAGMGLILGAGGAAAFGQMLRRFLFGISSLDPLAMFGAAAVLVACALVASWLPARRASSVDPLVALRE